MSFFTTNLGDSYGLRPAGYAALIILMIAIWLIGSIIGKNERKDRTGTHKQTVNSLLGVRQLVFSAMSMALAYVASLIKILEMPMGGSVTLLSMMFICMIGYWFGLKTGLAAAVSYGCLQLITDPYIISIPQMLTDYILAFGALGLSGIFHAKKQGLILGYLAGTAGRFVFSFLSGMIFFGSYASDYHMTAPVYSFLYTGAYIGAEVLLTLTVMALPPVNKAFVRVKQMAVGEQ